ncbi:trypsin-like serine protease, partial [bacterium]|nr:trypsin-like serine protease [bacterium]
ETKFNEAASDVKAFSIYSNEGNNSCSGDSGGPAYFVKDGNMYLLGVTSYGGHMYNCMMGDGVYIDARKYTEWLGSALK